MNPAILLTLWLSMLENTGDPKLFRNAQDAFNMNYKRANYSEQGEYHRLLALDHKRALACQNS